MRRTDGANADTDAFGSGKDGYKTSAPYTVLTPNAMNALQEEIARAIEGFGVSLVPATMNQLFTVMTVNNRSAVVQTTADQAVFGVTSTPNQHPSSASNKWKEILVCNTNNGCPVRLFVGVGDVNGCWAIAFNAHWNPASGDQNWNSDDTGVHSTLLIGLPSGFQMLRRSAGAGTWTSWSDQADLGVTGALTVGEDLVVTDDATANNVIAVVDVTSPVFNHPAPIGRTVSVDVSAGSVSDPSTASWANNGEYLQLGPSNSVIVPIRPPAGGTLGVVRVKVENNGGSVDYEMRLLRRHSYTFSGGAPTYTTVDTATATIVGLTNETSLSFGGLTISSDETYSIKIANTASNNLRVYVLEYEFADPGPRNH